LLLGKAWKRKDEHGYKSGEQHWEVEGRVSTVGEPRQRRGNAPTPEKESAAEKDASCDRRKGEKKKSLKQKISSENLLGSL